LQNHDQVGNRAWGERITELAPPRAVKLAMEILLPAPQVPLLFMGEEFAASTPFLFFCDFHGDLAAAVTKGRRSEFARFGKFNSPGARDSIPDPNNESTFLKSKLDWESLRSRVHEDWLHLYRELLAMRRNKIVPHLAGTTATQCEISGASRRLISVDWIFNDRAILKLRANLGDESLTLAKPNPGTLLYSSRVEAAAAFQQGSLAPWSVIWALRPG